MKTLYPLHITINVHITNEEADGSASYSFPLSKLPTDEDMPGIFEKIKSQLPDGFRLMTRHESLMYFIRNERGYRGPNLALDRLPDDEKWHDPETSDTMSFRNDEDEESDELY